MKLHPSDRVGIPQVDDRHLVAGAVPGHGPIALCRSPFVSDTKKLMPQAQAYFPGPAFLVNCKK